MLQSWVHTLGVLRKKTVLSSLSEVKEFNPLFCCQPYRVRLAHHHVPILTTACVEIFKPSCG